MRYWGMHYDTGVHFSPEHLSRPSFDPALVRFEMRAIRDDLHANAVRIVGEDVRRLQLAAEAAADCGLCVFLNPWLINGSEADTLKLLIECARIAETLRQRGTDVVFVLGCEHSLFAAGIIPGRDVYERVAWLVALRDGKPPTPSLEEVSRGVNAFLRVGAQRVREIFGGKITYAAGIWEFVDWEPFDFVGLDYYRSSQSDEEYAEGLRVAARAGKPVAVLEIGCCTYEGADEAGGMGWMLLDEWREGGPAWISGSPPERSEATQARYLREQLEIYSREGVHAVFVFTFTVGYLTHDPLDPDRDFDRACFSITKLLPPGTARGRALPPWEPKESFHVLAQEFAKFARDAQR